MFPADRWSGVAIAVRRVRPSRWSRCSSSNSNTTKKVEGHTLSIEGKANQLSQMVRNHLPAAMQGLAVVPIFAGYDRRRGRGRLWAFDVTGGRYEEEDYVASGSGSLHARSVIKLGHRQAQDESAAVDLVIHALYNAADEDSATGGPDSMRGIYPIIAVINGDGYHEVAEAEISQRFDAIVANLAELRSGAGSASSGEAHS
ncbi:MAG: proteasome subunit beta [Acidimicrobiales bacterium]